MIEEILQAMDESNKEHGITNYAVIVGKEQEDKMRQLEGFVDAEKLENVPKTIGTVVIIGRIPACWIAIWERVPREYIYTSEVFGGVLRSIGFEGYPYA